VVETAALRPDSDDPACRWNGAGGPPGTNRPHSPNFRSGCKRRLWLRSVTDSRRTIVTPWFIIYIRRTEHWHDRRDQPVAYVLLPMPRGPVQSPHRSQYLPIPAIAQL